MNFHARKSWVVWGLLCAVTALLLTGCPLWTHAPQMTIVKEGGQQIGISLSLTAGTTLTLQAQSTSASDSIVWSSSAPEIASVDGSGVVTAVAPGTAIITATGSASLVSASVQVQVTAGPSNEGETEGEAVTEGEAEGEGACLDEPVQMLPFSGRFGYGLSGAFSFTGTLTKQALTEPAWYLEGTFTFPTGGYAVGEPNIIVAESYPEQVSVTLGITAPPPDAMVTQVITQASISADIAVANGATFKIHTRTCTPGTVEGEREGEGPAEGEGEWVPQGEASWIPGETGPAAWVVKPPAPTELDVIHFAGPSAMHQNLCHALVDVGQPQVQIDPSRRQVRLVFLPVVTFAACDDIQKPVAGVQGSFGPLEKGDWIFYSQTDADPLLNFKISLHVGDAAPGLDPHVKSIPDDPDGDYLTEAEEAALGMAQIDPANSGAKIPIGVQMAHQLFAQIDQLPVCPVPVPDADGNSSATVPVMPPLCRTPVEANCVEACNVCGESYNCGFVALNRSGMAEPMTGIAAPLQVSFAALHYMQHGSLSFGWKNGGYAGRVDVVALVRLFNPPPPADPLAELIGLFLKADANGDGCLSVTDLKTVVPTADAKLISLLQQLAECPYAGPLADGTISSRPQPVDEVCFCGNVNATPELLEALLALVAGTADADGNQALSFAEAQAYLPSLTEKVFKFLDRNGDGVISAADLPNPPPLAWVGEGQCPEKWTIEPPAPTPGVPIHFSGPTPTFGNGCEAVSQMGTPFLKTDPAARKVELVFNPMPGPMPCPMVYAPVCGLQGVIGPLPEGPWVFFCQHPQATFMLSFTVQGTPPANCTEAQWIPGETGPKDWAVDILPLGAPVNGIRISGPTPLFPSDCNGQAALGGRPFLCRDDTARTLTLLFKGLRPEVCTDIYAPVCGIEAGVIGIPNGTWTFSAPTLTPPVLLTFSLGTDPVTGS